MARVWVRVRVGTRVSVGVGLVRDSSQGRSGVRVTISVRVGL